MSKDVWHKKASILFKHKNAEHLARLQYIFDPHSVAIAGVSTKNNNNPGNVIMNKVRDKAD